MKLAGETIVHCAPSRLSKALECWPITVSGPVFGTPNCLLKIATSGQLQTLLIAL